jgi:NAD-dependent deacetylase
VTQNIDTLHERAGSQDLLKVHGTSDRVRCSRPGCDNGSPLGSLDLAQIDFSRFAAQPDRSNLPCCPQCQSLLRAHVLFFDEYYLEHQDYRFVDAEALADEADTVLFIGTSFSVGITDLYLRTGHRRGIPMYTIDPAPAARQWPGLQTLAAPAEDLLPAVYSLLA